jgi:hypothetical protein
MEACGVGSPPPLFRITQRYYDARRQEPADDPEQGGQIIKVWTRQFNLPEETAGSFLVEMASHTRVF